MIMGKKIFINQKKKKKDITTYDYIFKITIGQRDDYITDCLLDYVYFKEYHKIIAIGLSKQQALDSDPKAMQQINFTGNLDQSNNTTTFFIIEEVKETILDFSQGAVKVL